MYIQVNIGRNVGTAPLDDDNWQWFRDTVVDTICSAVRMLNDVPRVELEAQIEQHRGLGQWGELDPEESCHISLYTELDVDLDFLRENLGYVKRMFDQDAIALIVGSELI